MIFTTFERVFIIKSIKFQLTQTAYQIHNIDHINILIDLVFEIIFEANSIFFKWGAKNTLPLPVLKGLKEFFEILY